MSTEPNGWLEQVKAKVRDLLASGNRKLDELEAQQAAERADKPWLSGDAPTLDSVRARIEWEEEARREAAGGHGKDGSGDRGDRGGKDGRGDRDDRGDGSRGGEVDGPDRGQRGRVGSSDSSGAGDEPMAGDARPHPTAEDAEREAIRVELEERERASRERLAEIRRELGIESDGADTDG